jgi:hypothetical protein
MPYFVLVFTHHAWIGGFFIVGVEAHAALFLVTVNATSYVTGGSFANNSLTINGWLRDFLWSEASQVIQSYGSPGGSYGLLFLGAHFVWAFSLMFLFSGRGY